MELDRGILRPVLEAVRSNGRWKTRVVPVEWRLLDAWDALEAWLDRWDPVPQLRMVSAAGSAQRALPAAEPRRVVVGRIVPSSIVTGAGATEDLYAYRVPPRRVIARELRPHRDSQPGDWWWNIEVALRRSAIGDHVEVRPTRGMICVRAPRMCRRRPP